MVKATEKCTPDRRTAPLDVSHEAWTVFVEINSLGWTREAITPFDVMTVLLNDPEVNVLVRRQVDVEYLHIRFYESMMKDAPGWGSDWDPLWNSTWDSGWIVDFDE